MFETKSGEQVEIDEKMRGFGAVLKGMERAFPNVPADWYEKVAFPPLQVNERILWHSGGDDSNATDK